jgi:hypothetical protein
VVSKSRFSGKTFPVVVGNDRVRSRILSSEADRAQYEKMGVKLLDVPEEYRPEFTRALEKSIREIGGCSTQAIEPFISQTEKILEGEDPTIPRVLETEEWVCGMPLEFHWNRVTKKVRKKLSSGYFEEAFELIRDPQAPRVVHIDASQGKKDAAGFAMGHIVRMIEVPRVDLQTLETYTEIVPLIEYDALLRILAKKGEEIELAELRALVYRFVEHGYHVAKVTTDSWQSVDTHQQFKKRGIKSEVLSVDTSMDPYEMLRTGLYEGRAKYPPHAKAKEEMQKLMRVQYGKSSAKVDHPSVKGASKDVSDAMAGVAMTLSLGVVSQPMDISYGAGRSVVEDDPESIDDRWVTDGRIAVRGDRSVVSADLGDLLPFLKG